jgi:septal ring factor EnvC (AmiA/AmiB activator)
MEVKTKSYFILIATLILGIIIGVAGSGMLRSYFFEKRMEKIRSPHGFIEHMEEIIKPDPSQKEELREKLESQQQQFSQLSMQFRTQMDSLNHEFQKELNDILTKEQQERLSKFFERRKPRFGDKEKHFPPPPPFPSGDIPPPPPSHPMQ